MIYKCLRQYIKKVTGGVSAVVGVIMMVALTILSGAVIGEFVLGLSDSIPEFSVNNDVKDVSKLKLTGVSIAEVAISVTKVRANAEGDDTEAPSEFVEISNNGTSSFTFDKFILKDAANHKLTRDDFTIPANSKKRVYTCELTTSDGVPGVEWDFCNAIWNNGGDTVIVKHGNTKKAELTYD